MSYRWLVVAMLWCISFFNYADRQAINSVLPLLQSELGLSMVQLGMLGSAFAWVYGFSGFFAGFVVDRISRKKAILGGLYAWSIICMATALSQGFRALFALRAAEGLGETIYYPASMSMVSDYHDKGTRSRAMGIHQTSVYAGTIAGGTFAGLIGQHYGWRWSFIVFGGLGVLLGFLLNRFLREPQRGRADSSQPASPSLTFRQFIQLLRRTPTMLCLTGAFICSNFVALVLLAWMPKFLFDKFHMSLAVAGLAATAFVQLASVLGSLTGGWLADILRKRTPRGRIFVQAVGVLCGAPFVAWCGMTQSVTSLIVALTAWGFCKGMYDANIFASLFDVVRPEARGTAAGFINSMGWIGGGWAPVAVGYLAQDYGLSAGITAASVVYLMACALLLIAAFFFVKKDIWQTQTQS
ncbi:MAG TPA: MFS transporter [Bryobacteraceae bacterium]|jgi:MFS family permease|nr:MFS transporter [Bryobacteraceae bacterium]